MKTSPYLRGLISSTMEGDVSLNVTLGFVHNSTSVTSSGDHEFTLTQNIFAYGSGLVFLAFIAWCGKSQVPGPEHRRGALIRQRFEERRLRRARRQRLEDPSFRQSRLEKALLKAKIKSYDTKTKQLTLGRTEGSIVDGDEVPFEETEESSTCVICLDLFEVGDTVAWSRSGMEATEEDSDKMCRHVFHEDCIKGWLARHEDCPSCRLTILELPEDVDDDETADVMNNSRHSPGDSNAFVIVRGLVSRVKRASLSLVGQTIDAGPGSSLPLRRVFSAGAPIPLRRRWSFRNNKKKSPPVTPARDAIELRRVKSIGPGSPVRQTNHDMYAGNVGNDDNLLATPALAPYPIPRPKTFGVPFRRMASFTALSVLSVPEDESITEDYEDDILPPLEILRQCGSSGGMTESDVESDDHTVPGGSHRSPLGLVPFRRVMSTGGTYAALAISNSGSSSDTDTWRRQGAIGRAKPSVSWRDSRLAVSKSEDEDDCNDAEDTVLLASS